MFVPGSMCRCLGMCPIKLRNVLSLVVPKSRIDAIINPETSQRIHFSYLLLGGTSEYKATQFKPFVARIETSE